MRSSSLTYVPALDGLRAVAVGLVVAIHAFPASGFPGGLGVDVFFVISGFLITQILLKEHARSGRISLRRFYFNRLVRLYPPVIVVAAVASVAYLALGGSLYLAARASGAAVTYTSNILMTIKGYALEYMSHTWSLSMEEQFYLLWPLLLLLMLRRNWSRNRMALTAIVLAAVSLLGWVFTAAVLPFNPLTKAGGLLLGCALALLHTRVASWGKRQAVAWAGIAVFAAVFVLETVGVIERGVSMPIATIAILPVILHATNGRSRLVSLLSWKPLVYLGVISYGLYLWHYPILWLMTTHLPWPTYMIAVVAVASTVILSAATYAFIEKPALRWRDRVSPRFANGGARTDDATKVSALSGPTASR